MARNSDDDGLGCLLFFLVIITGLWAYHHPFIFILTVVILYFIYLAIAEWIKLSAQKKAIQEAEERSRLEQQQEKDRILREDALAKKRALDELKSIYENYKKSVRDSKTELCLEQFRNESELLILDGHLETTNDLLKNLSTNKFEKYMAYTESIPSKETTSTKQIEQPTTRNSPENLLDNKELLKSTKRQLFQCPSARLKAEDMSYFDHLTEQYASVLIKIAHNCDDWSNKGCDYQCDYFRKEWNKYISTLTTSNKQ